MNKEEVTYITFLDRSKWALVNSFWASILHENIKPEKIILIANSSPENIEEIEEALTLIIKQEDIEDFGIEVEEIVDEPNFSKIGEITEKVFEENKDVVLDATAGSKALTISAIIQALKSNVEKIHYLHIDEVEDADKPYLDIPLTRHIPTEMREGEELV